MKKIQWFLLILLPLIYAHLYTLQNSLFIPVRIVDQKTVTLEQLELIGIKSKHLAQSIEMVSKQSGLSQEFLIALMFTESTGNLKAVSSKGYKGLMQIPHAVYYADANLLIGAHIFNEKMKQTNGDVVKALCLYKGYPIGSDRGLMQARKVLSLRDKLKSIKEV
jgi:soluble lytic murein transglycosylase-like protein